MEMQAVLLSAVMLFIQQSGVTSQTDVCSLGLKHGMCQANFEYYGMEDGVCKKFIYSGCGGNKNRFNTKADCERACPPSVGNRVTEPEPTVNEPEPTVTEPEIVDVNVCSLPAETGLCKARKPRWASVNGVCKQFIYGGCGGNANNFKTQSECEKACKEHSSTPMRPNRCYDTRADTTRMYYCSKKGYRWFYSERTDSCVKKRVCKRSYYYSHMSLPGYRTKGSCEKYCSLA